MKSLWVRIRWFFSKQNQTVFSGVNFNGCEFSEYSIVKNGVFYSDNVRYVIKNCSFTVFKQEQN